jgi:hypothetical protein
VVPGRSGSQLIDWLLPVLPASSALAVIGANAAPVSVVAVVLVQRAADGVPVKILGLGPALSRTGEIVE